MRVLSSKTFTRILGAELDKLMTLPLIWLTLMSTLIINVGLAAAYTSSSLQAEAGTFTILNTGLASMGYVQAGFIIIGIVAVCSEYTAGQIRTTLTTIPWRGWQLTAKYVAVAMVTIPAALIIAATGVLYTFIMMRDTASVAIEINTLIATLVGATGYLTLTSLLSAALGSLIRRTTPVLVTLVSYYFIVGPLMRDALPSIKNYFPDTAGYYMYMVPYANEINALTSVQGTGIVMVWTLILIIIAIVFYRKRDA